jgi:hypothetical protein
MRRDLLGAFAVIVVAAVYLSPALVDGAVFAPFDIANQLSGLTSGLSPVVHNHLDGDLATQMLSWNTLDWRLVHSGQFPLWNGYEALGMPQFLNFESSVLSLPDLVGYLVPLRDSFLVVVFVKLSLAGTGTYLFTRVAGGRPVAAWFAGVTYMLSGPFSGWVGWSMADVFAWAGFVAAFAVLAYRERGRPRYVVLLAVSVAFSVYGGFPEANLLLGVALGAVALVTGLVHLLRSRPPAWDGLARVAGACLAGAALSAPLWLPGISVLRTAARTKEAGLPALGLRDGVLTLFPGWNGLPTGAVPTSFGPVNYYETVSYVGIAALVLAIAAVVVLRRTALVVGLAVAGLGCAVATYGIFGFDPAHELLKAAGATSLGVGRSRILLAFVLAVLAGLGIEAMLVALAPRHRQPVERRREVLVDEPGRGPAVASDIAWARAYGDVLLGAALAVAVAVAVAAVVAATSKLPAAEHRARMASLLWPCVVTGATLALAGVVWLATRTVESRPRPVLRFGVVAVLLGGQAAYLAGTSGELNSYSHAFFPQDPATTELAADVGGALVGIDTGNLSDVASWGGVGFYPNVNVGYQVRQFTAHDPVFPLEYYSWPGTPAFGQSIVNLFAPSITTAAEAREYGIGFILAAARLARPAGTDFVATFAGVSLYRVPGAAQFSLAAAPAGASIGAITHPTERAWTVEVDTPAPATLVLHLTALDGWHVDAGGRPLAVRPYGTLMEQVVVPAGSHVLDVWYWPSELTTGIWLAAGGAFALLLWCSAAALLRRRSPARPRPAPAGAPPDPAGGSWPLGKESP